MNDQETIQILKGELYIMHEEREKEKELYEKEMNSLRDSFKNSYDLIAKKGDNAQKIADDLT